MRFFMLFAALLLGVYYSSSALNWATDGEPKRVTNNGQWTITFAVTESTDVEVSIVNKSDSSVVRHLAAGMLGANAPAPLIPSSLSQTLVWDGKDDYRKPVADIDNLEVRVRAGMSTRLDNYAGGDAYAGMDDLHGMELSDDGTVYIGGSTYCTTSSMLRQFTAKGEYIKTLFPITGAMPAAASSYWGTTIYNNTQWSPKSYVFGYVNHQTHSPLREWVSLIPMHEPGKVAVVNFGCKYYSAPLDGPAFSDWIMNSDGTRDASCDAASQQIIAHPLLNAWEYGWGGPLFFAMNKSRSHFFMSGFFLWNGQYYLNYDPTNRAISAADTGFYRDGRLFKVDMATRTATVFFDLDTVVTGGVERQNLFGNYNNAELHGVALDDSGRVYVCDKLHNKVWILDSTGAVLGALKAQGPDAIAVNSKTGAVYVTRYVSFDNYGTNYYYVSKYSDWRNDSTASIDYKARTLDRGVTYYLRCWHFKKSMLEVVETDEGTLVWFAASPGSVTIYKDQGASFSVYKDFNSLNKQTMVGIYRVAADAKTEQVYINAVGQTYRINSWGNPLITPLLTSSSYDVNIDSDRRYLYTRGGSRVGGALLRYAMGAGGGLSFLDTVGGWYDVRSSWGDNGDHGIAIAPNGSNAVIDCTPAQGYTSYVRFYPDSSTTAKTLILNPININNSGLAYDLAGNLYVGQKPASSTLNLPASVLADQGFQTTVGTIYRYKPTGSIDSLNFYPTQPVVDKVYAVDYADLGGGRPDNCTCLTSRFALDKFSRLYVPNAILQKLTLLDFNGNQIARIGTYGNIDNIRAEAAGATGTEGRCYVGYPRCVDATEDFIYVSDMTNCAVLRIQKEFALDNMPGFGLHTGVADPVGEILEPPVTLTATPNPWNPVSRITVSVPALNGAKTARLDVLALNGQVVRTLFNGKLSAGQHSYLWNAMNNDGKRVTTGMYVYRLILGNKVMHCKTLLVK